MKKITLIIACVLLVSVAIQAQEGRTYQPVLSSELVEWRGVTDYYDGYYNNYYVYTGGDTIVDGTSYAKIMTGQSTVKLLFREEIMLGRIWCRYPQGAGEFIIYDISLEPGDSISLVGDYHFGNDDTCFYYVTDTLTVDGHRMIMLLSNRGREVKFIESVGCSNLLDYVTGFNYPVSRVICCHKDGELFYIEPGFDRCDIPYVGIDGFSNKKVDIAPNPCRGRIYIRGEDIKSLKLYNQEGKELVEIRSPVSSIDLSLYPAGVYFIRISSSNEKVWKKIIKL